MGCFGSKSVDEERSHSIDRQLKAVKEATQNDIKLLLLGAGESGKSTIKTQMRLLEGKPLTENEKDQFTDVCRTNMIASLQIILDNMALLGISLSDSSLHVQAELIVGLPNENGSVGLSSVDGELLPGVLDAILVLWKDPNVQLTLSRSNEYQLNDSAEYFLSHAERIGARGWKPTEMDVLKARVKTTGISETRFVKMGRNFIVVDVGGQRSERRKWLYCFESVTSLIYVVALNEYNMWLREDESVNRMKEALVLYHSIVTSPYFSNVPLILFLNKADLLRRKCRSGQESQMIGNYYPEFTGDSTDWKQVFRFIERLFIESPSKDPNLKPDPNSRDLKREESKKKIRDKVVYSHMCTAVDKENMKAVLGDVTEIILGNNLKASSLV